MFRLFLMVSNLLSGLLIIMGLWQLSTALWIVQLPALAFYVCGLFLTLLSWRNGSNVARWTAFSFQGLAVLLSPNSTVIMNLSAVFVPLVSLFSLGGLAALMWVTLAFPDGHLYGRGRLVLVGGWLSLIIILLFKQDWAWLGVGISLVWALFEQRQRYLNTPHSLVRQQMRWMMTGLSMVIGGSIAFVVLIIMSQLLPLNLRTLIVLLIAPFGTASLLALPACLLIAILRYRLWDESPVDAIEIPEDPLPTSNKDVSSDLLTSRELEVLQLVAEGCSNQQIADQLVISLNTVKRHMTNIYNKLDVTRRTEAVHQARQRGFLPK